eukprot:Rhum_TRINITY_DN14832_c0_g2::Rhum_TRINITY_DN14832_c0_g2_i1::g.124676::m.124676
MQRRCRHPARRGCARRRRAERQPALRRLLQRRRSGRHRLRQPAVVAVGGQRRRHGRRCHRHDLRLCKLRHADNPDGRPARRGSRRHRSGGGRRRRHRLLAPQAACGLLELLGGSAGRGVAAARAPLRGAHNRALQLRRGGALEVADEGLGALGLLGSDARVLAGVAEQLQQVCGGGGGGDGGNDGRHLGRQRLVGDAEAEDELACDRHADCAEALHGDDAPHGVARRLQHLRAVVLDLRTQRGPQLLHALHQVRALRLASGLGCRNALQQQQTVLEGRAQGRKRGVVEGHVGRCGGAAGTVLAHRRVGQRQHAAVDDGPRLEEPSCRRGQGLEGVEEGEGHGAPLARHRNVRGVLHLDLDHLAQRRQRREKLGQVLADLLQDPLVVLHALRVQCEHAGGAVQDLVLVHGHGGGARLLVEGGGCALQLRQQRLHDDVDAEVHLLSRVVHVAHEQLDVRDGLRHPLRRSRTVDLHAQARRHLALLLLHHSDARNPAHRKNSKEKEKEKKGNHATAESSFFLCVSIHLSL